MGELLGGIGLFLLGTGLLTDGLQAAAGSALRTILRRATRSRGSAVALGALATAIAQSSSATTVLVIGFVGAGLLPLASALGVIYGANVGTTATAWIVAGIGLKLDAGLFALPLVGVGALAKLFLPGRRAALGAALAGFGLLFVGIDLMRTGMGDLSQYLSPTAHDATDLGGRLFLVGIGIAMTVVLQSSSAAVATALAAIQEGALGFDQAAALVIGQNVGTTVTALLAAAGGSPPARRAALGHLAFNLGTAAVALALLPAFVALVTRAVGSAGLSITLAAFHTAFNVLGVLLFLPLTGSLSRWLERLVPERGHSVTRRLSSAATTVPAVAVQAAHATALEISQLALDLAARMVSRRAGPAAEPRLRETLVAAILTTRQHLFAVRSEVAGPSVYRQHVAVLHCLDHLHRLMEALGERDNAERAADLEELAEQKRTLAELLDEVSQWAGRGGVGLAPDIEAASRRIAERRRVLRANLLEQTARGKLDPDSAEASLEAIRWVDRIGYHGYRATYHLVQAESDLPGAPPPAPETEGRRGDETFDVTGRGNG